MIERLLRDGAVYAVAALVSRGAAFVVVPIYTRLLDARNYGALDLILTAGLLINLVVALEVGQGLAREWSEQPGETERRRLGSTALGFTALAHAAFLALALAASAPLAQALLGSRDYVPELRAGLVFIAANAVFLHLQDQFRWRMRARAYAAASALHAALTLALGTGGGVALGLQGILWGQALAAGAAAACCLALLRGQLGAGIDRTLLARMLRFSLPLVASGVTMFIAFQANRFLLSGIASLAELGLFGVGQRVAALTLLLAIGLQGALTPLVYRHHAEPGVPAELARLFEGFAGVAAIACLLLAVFARELIGWIATPGFVAAAPLLAWLAPAAVLGQMYIFAPGIAIERKTHWQLALTAASAALALALNLASIPRWGALGAAVSNLAAACIFLGLWVAASQRVYPLPLRWGRIAAVAAAYAVLAWFGVTIDGQGWSAPAAAAAKGATVALLAALVGRTGLVRWRSLFALVLPGPARDGAR